MSVHFRSDSDEWETPRDLFDQYNKIYNFTIDVAASDTNALCDEYYTIFDDALTKKWTGTCWCNPPYSNIKQWIKKSYEESLSGNIIVMLIPARTDTAAWHDYIFPYARIGFLRGRLKFSNSKNSAPFPSAIVIFGVSNEERTVRGSISV